MKLRSIRDIESLSGKVVFLRADLNVPVTDNKITDYTRINNFLPTLKLLTAGGAIVLLASHFKRPKGKYVSDMSLKFVANELAALLGHSVSFVDDCIGKNVGNALASASAGDVILLENLRFHPGEEQNDEVFAASLAEYADICVNDAFSCSHRAHASIVGIASHLPIYAGLFLEKEVQNIDKCLQLGEGKKAAIIGGAKISDKIKLLHNLVKTSNYVLVGGAMANTFLAARGLDVANSLCESAMLDEARAIMSAAKDSGCELLLPVDVLMAKGLDDNSCIVCDVDNMSAGYMALDVGPRTVRMFIDALGGVSSVVWNGPLGLFENRLFSMGTLSVASFVALRSALGSMHSVVGGGDTIASLQSDDVVRGISYVSGAGGAFMEWLEGRGLPGVNILTQS